jgi:membrane fusion protein
MNESLFRQQALKEFKQRVSGEPLARLPAAWSYVAALVVLALVAAIVFLTMNDYARKEKAVGWLRYASGEFALFAPMSGTVEALQFEEGQRISEGEPLFVIHAPQTSTEGAEFSAEYARSIELEIELIQARGDNAQSTLMARMNETRTQIEALTSQMLALDQQFRVARERRALLDQQYQTAVDLTERGAISRRVLEERHVLALNQHETESALAVRRAEYAGALELQRARLEQMPLLAEENALLARQSRIQLERDLLEARTRQEVLVTAPASGRIAAKQASAGGSIRAGERALTIVADDSLLQGEIYLPSRAMARIRPGQEVRIYYTAFPHRRYGVATGRIETVSTTVFRPEEIPTPLGMEEAAYRAIVILDAQAIEAFGDRFELRSGMTLTAEVILERQSLFEWLLEPLSRST